MQFLTVTPHSNCPSNLSKVLIHSIQTSLCTNLNQKRARLKDVNMTLNKNLTIV